MFTCRPSPCPQRDPDFLKKRKKKKTLKTLYCWLLHFTLNRQSASFLTDISLSTHWYTSLCAGPIHRLQRQSRHQITVQMPASLHSSFLCRKELFPAPLCASACIILRKSAFICTDSKSGCGRQFFFSLPPYILNVGKRIWSVKTVEDKIIRQPGFRFQLITGCLIFNVICWRCL